MISRNRTMSEPYVGSILTCGSVVLSEIFLFFLYLWIPIFWCLFSPLVQRRWKSDVFQPESNDIFYSVQNTFRPDTFRCDVKSANKTNKQTKVQIQQRFPDESLIKCSLSPSIYSTVAVCWLQNLNIEHQFCNLFPRGSGWNKRGTRSNVCKWQPNTPRRPFSRRSFLHTFTKVHVLLLAADTCEFMRQTCCHLLINPPSFAQWQSVSEAFKCYVKIGNFRVACSCWCGPEGHYVTFILPVEPSFPFVYHDDGASVSGYSWFHQAVKEGERSLVNVNVIHSSFSVFAEAFVSAWWMLCQRLLRF